MTSAIFAAVLTAIGVLCLSTGKANQWRIWRYQIGAGVCFFLAVGCLVM